jgi:hypothetical protein
MPPECGFCGAGFVDADAVALHEQVCDRRLPTTDEALAWFYRVQRMQRGRELLGRVLAQLVRNLLEPPSVQRWCAVTDIKIGYRALCAALSIPKEDVD